jgi:hypothetical protein
MGPFGKVEDIERLADSAQYVQARRSATATR